MELGWLVYTIRGVLSETERLRSGVCIVIGAEGGGGGFGWEGLEGAYSGLYHGTDGLGCACEGHDSCCF